MAFAHIVSTGAGATGSTPDVATTPSIDTTGADLIVVAVTWYAGGSPPGLALTDSKSNTWSALTTYDDISVTEHVKFYYCVSPSVGSGHTFSFNANTVDVFSSICVTAWSGAFTSGSPYDQLNGAGSNGSGSTMQSGSITPTEDNTLVVAAVAFDDNSSGAVSLDGGFTIRNSQPFVTGHSLACSIATLVQTSAAAANPTWNITNSAATREATIASFKSVAGGGGGGSTPPSMRLAALGVG